LETADVTVTLYENSAPPFSGADFGPLYAQIYSSLAHHKICGGVSDDTGTYVAEKNGEASCVLLFQYSERQLHVRNEQINIDAAEIDRFARQLFKALP
jgi:hypothetical protein